MYVQTFLIKSLIIVCTPKRSPQNINGFVEKGTKHHR